VRFARRFVLLVPLGMALAGRRPVQLFTFDLDEDRRAAAPDAPAPRGPRGGRLLLSVDDAAPEFEHESNQIVWLELGHRADGVQPPAAALPSAQVSEHLVSLRRMCGTFCRRSIGSPHPVVSVGWSGVVVDDRLGVGP
jgi:hypothetical protein